MKENNYTFYNSMIDGAKNYSSTQIILATKNFIDNFFL